MKSLGDMINRTESGIPPENTPISSNPDSEYDLHACPLCAATPVICAGLGVVKYDVPLEDQRFGKLFRCPNYPVEIDSDRQDKLRKLSNLEAFADKTLDNFLTDEKSWTPQEQESLGAAKYVVQRFADNPQDWLLLEGGFGCGKTHLAAAVGNMRLAHGDNVLFVTTPDLLDHLRSAYGPSSEVGYDETFERVRNTTMLILDDLGVENPSPWAQEKLFQLLNHRYSHRLPTIITTNADPDNLDARIRSRLLDNNLISRVKIRAPDYRNLAPNKRFQLLSNLELYREMTFQTFDDRTRLVQREKVNLQGALRKAEEFADRPGGWLVFLGQFGTGKTHLAAAIAHYRRERGDEVMFITVPDLLDYLRVAFGPNVPVSFDQRFQAIRSVSFLVLDDLGTENATPWAQEKLFQIVDYRYVAGLPTVITSAKELEKLNERIQSRLLDSRRCTIFAITAPSYALRMGRRR